MNSQIEQTALHVALNPAQYAQDPDLLAAAFLALKRSRGQVVHPEHLGPRRHQIAGIGTVCYLVQRIRARQAQAPHPRPARLICPGAST